MKSGLHLLETQVTRTSTSLTTTNHAYNPNKKNGHHLLWASIFIFCFTFIMIFFARSALFLLWNIIYFMGSVWTMYRWGSSLSYAWKEVKRPRQYFVGFWLNKKPKTPCWLRQNFKQSAFASLTGCQNLLKQNGDYKQDQSSISIDN